MKLIGVMLFIIGTVMMFDSATYNTFPNSEFVGGLLCLIIGICLMDSTPEDFDTDDD